MSGLKVWCDSADPKLWRILITAKISNVDVETHTGLHAHSTEAVEKNPLGKVPILETPHGSISEANAISRYVARLSKGHLYGSNDFEAGQIEQFLDFAATDIEVPSSVWIFPILGYIPNNSVATQKAKGDIRKVMDYLNKHLLTRTYLVGERITLADIVVSMSLYYLYAKVMDNSFRKSYINTNRWFLTCINQPLFKAVVGEFKICESMEVAPEVEKKEEPKKEKKEEPKKEAKKVAKKEEEDAADEDDEFADKEAKKPNVLDALPPSKFIMDEWKRTYSNKETRPEALPWLWEHLDKEGYSIWICDYKYNHELEKTFKTCNLIGGWFQRLDKLRKYGFGSVCIFGQDPSLEVSGCWMFRGQEPPQEMKETDDFEHYTWRKVDTADASQKELVNDFFAWDGPFGGAHKEFNQGKIYK